MGYQQGSKPDAEHTFWLVHNPIPRSGRVVPSTRVDPRLDHGLLRRRLLLGKAFFVYLPSLLKDQRLPTISDPRLQFVNPIRAIHLLRDDAHRLPELPPRRPRGTPKR